MTFWDWFQKDGDKVFAFVSLASLALQHTPGVNPTFSESLVIGGVLATCAHNTFFPLAPKEQPK